MRVRKRRLIDIRDRSREQSTERRLARRLRVARRYCVCRHSITKYSRTFRIDVIPRYYSSQKRASLSDDERRMTRNNKRTEPCSDCGRIRTHTRQQRRTHCQRNWRKTRVIRHNYPIVALRSDNASTDTPMLFLLSRAHEIKRHARCS